MKQYLPSFLLTAFLLSGCNLDIPLENEIGGYDAINTVQRAQDAMNAAFDLYPKANCVEYALLSEDFMPTHLINESTQGEEKLYRWDAEQIRFLSDNLWSSYYSVIVQVNNLLLSEKYISLQNESDKEKWRFIKANILGVKAMAYYELLALFSPSFHAENPGIILKSNVKYEKPNRSNAGACLREITQLLSESQELFQTTSAGLGSHYYLHQHAVLLLRARVALYAGDYKEAAEFAETLISEIGYKQVTPDANDYKRLWDESSKSQSEERIFLFDNYNYLFRQFDLKERGDMVAVSPAFDYATNDLRYAVASFPSTLVDYRGDSMDVCLSGKHRLKMNDRRPMPVQWLRTAEAYFILGECYIALGDEGKAKNAVNVVLKKRNAELLSSSLGGDELKARIRWEKQKEFAGEGGNLFDLKRWGQAIRRYAINGTGVASVITADDYRRTFPIPLSEITGNEAIVQNEGWPTIVK